MQGFDLSSQGIKKFMEFCKRLESCEVMLEKPIPKKVSFSKETVTPKRKRGMEKAVKAKWSSGLCKYYCKLHK